MQFDIPAFVRSLRFLAEGWLGVFLVMAVIIAAVRLLNGRLTAKNRPSGAVLQKT